MDRTPFYRTSTRTSFFEHRTNLNVFINWWSNSITWILASNKRTSNIKCLNLIYLTIHQTDSKRFFFTLNELERVHFLVIELEHPNFGFKQSNIELQTSFDPSLFFSLFTCRTHDWKHVQARIIIQSCSRILAYKVNFFTSSIFGSIVCSH